MADLQQPAPASMNPDDFSTGRPDKFIGTPRKVVAYPYKGRNSKDGKWYLNIGVYIEPEEGSGYEPFWEPYSGGFLNSGWPSKDNKTTAGATVEEYTALSNGKGEPEKPCQDEKGNILVDSPYVGEYVLGSLVKGRTWEQFGTALKDSDTKGVVDFSRPGYLGFAVGIKCRFDRVPQKGDKEFKTLVPTEIISASGAGEGKKPQGASTGGATSSTKDFEAAVKAEIVSFLKTQDGGKAKKGVLVSKVSNLMKEKGFDKASVMAWIGDADPEDKTLAVNLLDIAGTVFDADTQTLELDS